eukprot:jgi/Hompol1/5077/HPOL_001299-RA
MVYRSVIDQFRLEFARKRAALKVRLASSGIAEDDRKRVPKIQVCVRKRPMFSKEISNRNYDVVTTASETFPYAHIYIHEPKVRVDMSHDMNTHRFMFDNVFDDNATNEQVHAKTTASLVQTLFRGGRVTLFAYGQTGSGKTHTIFGTSESPGLFDFACRDIFANLASPSFAHHKLAVHVSFFEIYGGRIYDLFSERSRVQLLEDRNGNARLHGHREYRVEHIRDMIELIKFGAQLRTTGSTEANSQSSRSHAIIQMDLRTPQGLLFGKFSLVDLAGSERGVDTGNISREARVEGSEINKSLLALKECIRALHKHNTASFSYNANGLPDNYSTHIPFRASKLTQILRDSFVGKRSQTIMVAMISPGSNSIEHTLNTLRYADRVKEFRKSQANRSATAECAENVSSFAPDSPEASTIYAVKVYQGC